MTKLQSCARADPSAGLKTHSVIINTVWTNEGMRLCALSLQKAKHKVFSRELSKRGLHACEKTEDDVTLLQSRIVKSEAKGNMGTNCKLSRPEIRCQKSFYYQLASSIWPYLTFLYMIQEDLGCCTPCRSLRTLKCTLPGEIATATSSSYQKSWYNEELRPSIMTRCVSYAPASFSYSVNEFKNGSLQTDVVQHCIVDLGRDPHPEPALPESNGHLYLLLMQQIRVQTGWAFSTGGEFDKLWQLYGCHMGAWSIRAWTSRKFMT